MNYWSRSQQARQDCIYVIVPHKYSCITPTYMHVLYTTGEITYIRIETSCTIECKPAVICSNNSFPIKFAHFCMVTNLLPHETWWLDFCFHLTGVWSIPLHWRGVKGPAPIAALVCRMGFWPKTPICPRPPLWYLPQYLSPGSTWHCTANICSTCYIMYCIMQSIRECSSTLYVGMVHVHYISLLSVWWWRSATTIHVEYIIH